ncbi:MAG: LysE family translocator [Phycisphaerae bacterium]|nr:LysE family translocator [Phycisphaerae bacterium]
MWLSSVKVLVAVFIIGFVAAAPIGPVNMVAIRRGIVGRWTHTLACGIGSVIGDLLLFALVLMGGSFLLPDLTQPDKAKTAQIVLSLVGALVLLPLGSYFLYKAFKNPVQEYARARRSLRAAPPKHLIMDVLTGGALTIVNPASMLYWVLQTAAWLHLAEGTELGKSAKWWGLAFAGAGLMTWFTILTFFVRFMPDRLGPGFFRVVNILSGLLLIGFGIASAVMFIRGMFYM